MISFDEFPRGRNQNLSKVTMTFREPDLIPVQHDNLGKRLCKSLNDISDHYMDTTNNNNNNNNNVIRSHGCRGHNDNIIYSRQMSHPNETDIELETQITKTFPLSYPSYPMGLKRCSPDFFTCMSSSLHGDETDGDAIQEQHHKLPQIVVTEEDSSNSPAIETETEKIRRLFHLRANAHIRKHFPEVSVDDSLNGNAEDQKMCREIVAGLKKVADTYDKKNKGQSTIRALQETLNIDLTQVFLCHCFHNGMVPAIAKTALALVQEYNRL